MPMTVVGKSTPPLSQRRRIHPSRRSGACSRSRGSFAPRRPAGAPRAIARTIAASLGYETVAINLYRPAWDDFWSRPCTGTRRRPSLVGLVRDTRTGSRCWRTASPARRVLRPGRRVASAGRALRADAPRRRPPARHPLGRRAGEPPPRDRRGARRARRARRPRSARGAVGAGGRGSRAAPARARAAAARVVRAQRRAERGRDHARVCAGVRDALGFQNVLALSSTRRPAGSSRARPSAGSIEGRRLDGPSSSPTSTPLLDPEFEIEGCFLAPERRGGAAGARARSSCTRRSATAAGRSAWDRHWLLVPLHDAADGVIGILSADEPEDRLLPSAEKLQALRIFANQAAAAIVAAENVQELRFLADHDPLTRLLNRRAFVDRLEAEVARALRYGREFGLVLCDLDGFKSVNDRLGHPAGDDALQTFARIVREGAAQARRRVPHRRRRVRAAARRGGGGRRARGDAPDRRAARASEDAAARHARELRRRRVPGRRRRRADALPARRRGPLPGQAQRLRHPVRGLRDPPSTIAACRSTSCPSSTRASG